MKKLNYITKKLYDGLEDSCLTEKFTISIESKNYSVNLKEFYNNSFNDLDEIIGLIEFNTIVVNEKFVRNDFDRKFYSTENLELLYLQKEDYLIIFSYGEIQPARYLLTVECIYSI